MNRFGISVYSDMSGITFPTFALLIHTVDYFQKLLSKNLNYQYDQVATIKNK